MVKRRKVSVKTPPATRAVQIPPMTVPDPLYAYGRKYNAKSKSDVIIVNGVNSQATSSSTCQDNLIIPPAMIADPDEFLTVIHSTVNIKGNPI